MTTSRRARARSLVVVALCGLVVAGCGNHADPLEIGLRHVALDLAFKDPEKAVPVSPRQVITQLDLFDDRTEAEVPLDEEPAARTPRVIVIPPRKPEPVCEAAPAGANYDVPTYAVVKDPPVLGTYTRHNTGTLKVETAAFNLDFPYPAKSKVEISNLGYVNANDTVTDDDAKPVGGVPAAVRDNATTYPPRVEFTMTRHGPSGLKTVDTYRYSTGGTTGGDFIWLVRRVTTFGGVTTEFNPTPPIRYVKLFVPEGGTAAESTHGGVDRATNTALTVDSKIVSRESVDVCGTVVDTFRVQIQENFVDLSQGSPQTSGNETGTANFWNIQFDHGLLIVREEVHSTYHGTTKIAGAPVPVTLRYDYTSTLDSLDPQPPSALPGSVGAPGDDGGSGE